MINSRTFLTAALVGALLSGAALFAEKKICQPGTDVTTSVQSWTTDSQTGLQILHTISTRIRGDATCVDVEITNTCSLVTASPRTRVASNDSVRYVDGTMSVGPTTVDSETGTYQACG